MNHFAFFSSTFFMNMGEVVFTIGQLEAIVGLWLLLLQLGLAVKCKTSVDLPFDSEILSMLSISSKLCCCFSSIFRNIDLSSIETAGTLLLQAILIVAISFKFYFPLSCFCVILTRKRFK